jgi:inosose dehydratase
MSNLNWSYGLNAWRHGHDLFVRPDEHERALKTVSVSGFKSVELKAGFGRWEAMGNREMIEVNHGSLAGLRQFLNACAVDGLSSFIFEPGAFVSLKDGLPMSPANPAHHEEIADLVQEYVEVLPQLGGNRLVVAASPAWWRFPDAPAELMQNLAACRNGAAARAKGSKVQLSLNLDCVSSVLRTPDAVSRLLDATDADTVGLTIDTAEYTIAKLDPLAVYKTFKGRVNHWQFKNVKTTDELDEYKLKNAEHHFMMAGGKREIERWFWEMDAAGGLVDFPAIASALKADGYDGWVVVESDQSPYPATSCMLNGWYVKHRL